MKKTAIYSILFFLATAVIFIYSAACKPDDLPVTYKLVNINGQKVIVDKNGNALAKFRGHSSDPNISSVEFVARVDEGSGSSKPTPTSKAAGNTVRVVSSGIDCTVFFHTNDPQNFTGATVVVTPVKFIYKDGHIGFFTSQNAVPSASVTILPRPVDPDDPDNPDDPDDPDEPEETSGLELAEELDSNTFFIQDNVLSMSSSDGGYSAYHKTFDANNNLLFYEVHCYDGFDGYAELWITPELLGKEIDVLSQKPLTKAAASPYVHLYFESLQDPTQPGSDLNPILTYSTDTEYFDSDFEVVKATAKVVLNSDGTIDALGYLKTAEGYEAYTNLHATHGTDYIEEPK